jgi:hypothetical protein
MKYFGLRHLSHAPDLAAALGNMVVAWAYAEHTLLQARSARPRAKIELQTPPYCGRASISR